MKLRTTRVQSRNKAVCKECAWKDHGGYKARLHVALTGHTVSESRGYTVKAVA